MNNAPHQQNIQFYFPSEAFTQKERIHCVLYEPLSSNHNIIQKKNLNLQTK